MLHELNVEAMQTNKKIWFFSGISDRNWGWEMHKLWMLLSKWCIEIIHLQILRMYFDILEWKEIFYLLNVIKDATLSTTCPSHQNFKWSQKNNPKKQNKKKSQNKFLSVKRFFLSVISILVGFSFGCFGSPGLCR